MRFFKLYGTFLSQHFKRLMEYRVDFLTGATSFLINQVMNILFIGIIFSQITALKGFSYHEILFIYGYSLIPKGIDHLFNDNLWKLAYYYVNRGDFDRYLTRPINPLVHIIIEDFQFDALGELIMGVILITYASTKLGLHFGPVEVTLLILAIVFGVLIYASLKIAIAAIAFWIKRSGSILHMFYMSSDFAKYPVTIYNGFIKFIITYIIPFAFAAYYPASYFIKGGSVWFNIGGTVIIGTIMLLISLVIWHKGLAAYESAGS